jgi:hypothetical protein
MKVSDGLFSYREDVAVQNDKKKISLLIKMSSKK